MGVIKKIYTATITVDLTGYTAASNGAGLTYTVISDVGSIGLTVIKNSISFPTDAIDISIEDSETQSVMAICETVPGYIINYYSDPTPGTSYVSIFAGNFNLTDTQATDIIDAMAILKVTIKFTKV